MKVEMNHRAVVRGQDEWFQRLKVESHTNTQLIILPTSFLYCVAVQGQTTKLQLWWFFLLRLKVSMFGDVFTQFYCSSGPRDPLK